MNLLYIGNILPLEVVKKHKLSAAGKKYELNLINSIYRNKDIDDRLNVISLESKGNEKKYNIADSFWQVKNISIPILRDFVFYLSLIPFLLKYLRNNSTENNKIIVLNSPVILSLFLFLFKHKFRYQMFSLCIDSPLANINWRSLRILLTIYYYLRGRLSLFCLTLYDGIFGLNKNLASKVRRNKFYLTKIGLDYNIKSEKSLDIITNKFNVMFAGTLIDYNGISILLEVFKGMDNVIFNIYGSGPLENHVINYANKYSNIKYYGYINNDELVKNYIGNEVLVNFRINNNQVDYFGFPSKLIEYLSTGKVVVSTKFSALPDDLLKFLVLINSNDIEKIRKVFNNVFSNYSIYVGRSLSNVDKLNRSYNWDSIAKTILDNIKFG